MKFIILIAVLIAISSAAVVLESCLFEGCECSFEPSSNSSTFDVICEVKGTAPKNQFPKRNYSFSAENASIGSIMFIKNYFETIPDDQLANLDIKRLFLTRNNLTQISLSALKGLQLRELYISEPTLDVIESGALKNFYDLPITLYLDQMSLSDGKYASLSNQELKRLKSLKSLSLESNALTELRANQFGDLERLEWLTLSFNSINRIDPNAFAKNQKLSMLDLTRNQLDDLNEIFEALKPINNPNRLTLNLESNPIVNISTNLSNSNIQVSSISLKGNGISEFGADSLRGLEFYLTKLLLDYNQISWIDDEALNRFTSLEILMLPGNQLTRIPSILNLKRLAILDLSVQGSGTNKLTELPDYAFDRREFSSQPLSINLDANALTKFGRKTFCSNYHTSDARSIGSLKFSFDTMKNTFDKCFFKQLPWVTIDVAAPPDGSTDYSKVCNCDMFVFARHFNANLTGVCSTFTDSCSTTPFVDNCSTEFTCAQVSTTTSTHRMSTTSGGVGGAAGRFESMGLMMMMIYFFIFAFLNH